MENNRFGVAIDIGTTTIAVYLVDLETGEKLKTVGEMNAQAKFGADVTSRILYCEKNGHEELTAAIRGQINIAIEAFAVPREKIERVVIAANTIMQHLAAGYSPVSMGTAPFSPVSLFGETLPVWDSLPVSKDAGIYYTPAVSAYVGGDITAGLLAADFEDISGNALFVDIGTNSEIALKNKGIYYCCAAAAGPAFEGLSSVKLYGSELIDLLAEMRSAGAIDETGRLISKESQISAGDIRALQLAKAAIAGGIQVLLFYAGIEASDVNMLALAGGFGSYLNPSSAVRIGLFPKEMLPVAKAFGNTSAEGAAIALCRPDAASSLERIRKKCEYIELSSNAYFNDVFVEQMAM